LKKSWLTGGFIGLVCLGIGFVAGVLWTEDEVTMEWWIGEAVAEDQVDLVASYTNVENANNVSTIASIFIRGESVEMPVDIEWETPDYMFYWNDPSNFTATICVGMFI